MKERTQLGLRMTGELLLIVVGILVAFQFEGFREAREAEDRASAQLGALRADVEENRDRLQSVIGQQNRLVEQQRRLIRISNGDDPVLPTDSMVSIVNWSIQFFRIEPVLGAYDALVASGDLRLIRNTALRSRLASFMGDLRVGHEDEELSTLLRTELIGAISESTSFLSVMRPGMRAWADLPESSTEPDLEALLSNQRYLSHVTILAAIEGVVSGHYVSLEAEANRIIELIDAELE